MITNILQSKDFLEARGKNEIFVFFFSMLYQYEDIILKDLYEYWPKLKVKVSKKNLKKFEKITSASGKLYFISLRLSEPSDHKTQDENILILEEIIKNLESKENDSLKVKLSSFNVSSRDAYRNELLKIFATSDKRFEIFI